MPAPSPNGFDDSVLRPRPVAHQPRKRRRAVVSKYAGSGASRRTLGLPALLAGRAPWNAWHRQRRHGSADRPRGWWNIDDPRRCGRYHVAKSFATRDRRAIRHPGIALSRTYRPRPGSGTWIRPDHGAGNATRPCLGCSRVPAGCAGTCRLLLRLIPPACARCARLRIECTAVDTGLQPVRCATRGGTWAAVCIRITLRAGADVAGDCHLPRAVSPFGTTRQALRNAWLQCVCGRHRRRGSVPGDVHAAGLYQPAPRPTRSASCSGGRLCRSDRARGASITRRCVVVLGYWLAGGRASSAAQFHRPHRRGRIDDRVADL